MNPTTAKVLQEKLKALGFYTGIVDGDFGKGSMTALNEAIKNPKIAAELNAMFDIAWSAKVSKAFVQRVKLMAKQLKLPDDTGPTDLMACIAWESGETFSPAIKNGAGSGAVGLIQFMPTTAEGLGTTSAALAKMTPEEQLEYVYLYFKPNAGRLKNLGDLYMNILWPAAIGKPDETVLWWGESRPVIYRQNIGLDVNRDGSITRGECLIKVNEKRSKGLSLMNRALL